MSEVTSQQLKKSVFIRPDVPSDDYVAALILRFYRQLPYENEVIWDLGGCTGVFSVYACLRGCAKCYAYEPEQTNYDVLLRNVASYPQVEPTRAAITMRKEILIPFYLTTGASTDGYSAVEFRGRTKVEVPNLYFPDELERTKPSVIKMNIEGGEYELMEYDLPEYVKDVVMDIHFSKKAFRTEAYPRLVEKFKDWRAIITPKDTGKNFHTKGMWSRR